VELGLDRKLAVITGAGTGIGRAIARVLAQEGVQVVGVARRAAVLDALADEIADAGGKRPHIVTGDLSEAGAGARIADEITARFGRVDILVNSAGRSQPLSLQGTDEDWAQAFALRFTSVRQMIQRFIPNMKEQRYGRIINIGGLLEPQDVINAANAMNAARISFSKSLSREVGPYGITVNTIGPGFVESEQLDRDFTAEERAEMARRLIPAGYVGSADDIAWLVALLVSPKGRYITGEVIAVDGGMKRYGF